MHRNTTHQGLRHAAAALAAACLLVTALLVSACGSDDSSKSTAASDGSSSTPTKKQAKLGSILFVNPLPDNPQWRLLGDALKKDSSALGIELTETGPTQAADPTKMIQQIQQGIANKAGAILTYPASPAFGPVLEQAAKAGIITGTLYGGAASATGQFNLGPDWGKLGELYVKALASRPGPQRVGLLAADQTGTGKAWVDGFKAAAAKTDNVTIAGVVYTGDDPAKALSQANSLLAAHPDITVMASHMGTATTPTVSAIKSKGKKGKVIMLANGAVAGGLEGAKEGIVYRFLLQNIAGAAASAVNAAADLAAGKKVPAEVPVDGVMSGLDEYQGYKAKGWA